MIEELDIVALKTGLPDTGLEAGEQGTVVLAGVPGVFGVEFPSLWEGASSPVVEVAADELRLVAKHVASPAPRAGAAAR